MTTAAPTTLAPTASPTTLAPTTIITTEPPLTSAPTTLAPTTTLTTALPCTMQDFTDYTVRGASHVAVTETDVVWENWKSRVEECRVYKDLGDTWFNGDFEHQFDFQIDYCSGAYNEVGIWGISAAVGGVVDWAGPYVRLFYVDAIYSFCYEVAHETAGGLTGCFGAAGALSRETTYYARVIRDESLGTHGHLIFQIFSDAARTSLVLEKVVELLEQDDYRSVYTLTSNLVETPTLIHQRALSSGKISNLCIWDEAIHAEVGLTTAAPVSTVAPTTLAPTTAPPTVVAATIPCCTLTPRTYAPGTELPSTKDMPTSCKTICTFNGQIIMGNIMSTWYDCYENSVAWSDIGHSDFTLDESQNIAGYMHMPWEGEVLRVFRLGNFVMVYGDNGVAALQPHVEPEPTFGLVELDSIIGLAGREAWCGNYQKHYFVDRAGALWEIDAKLQVKKHDYREYLAGLTGTNLVLSYNEADDEVYISNGTSAFIKTPQGLTATYQLVKSMRYKDGTLFATLDEAADDSVILETDTFDMGVRGIKTLTTIEAGVTQELGDTEDVEIAVKWRSSKTSAFTQTGWQVVNPQGALTFFVSATEFRVMLRCATANDLDIDYLNVRYKVSDKRYQRGFSPSQTGKESGGGEA